jgi:murein DD-endopeptidase MepM/ murein hydrolase activator NlpD
MNVRNGIFGFFLAAWAFSLALPPAELAAEEKVHTVQQGETVYSISRTLGIDRDELMKFNGIADPTKLRVGQRLKIPGSESPGASGGAAPAAAYNEYRAVRGDTLYSIARRHSATVEAILEANSLSRDYVLKQGDLLRIPASGALAPQAVTARPEAPSGASPLPVPAGAAPRAVVSRTLDASVRWPVAAREVSYMTGKLSGVVLTGERAESVKSLTQGTVISAGPYRGFGRVAIVQVSGGYLYVYGGCESLSVKEGDKVGSGTELGRLGLDALSEKPQLFFLVYRNNTPVDPAKAPRA